MANLNKNKKDYDQEEDLDIVPTTSSGKKGSNVSTVYRYTREDLKSVSSKENRKKAKYLIELLRVNPLFRKDGRKHISADVRRAVVNACSHI